MLRCLERMKGKTVKVTMATRISGASIENTVNPYDALWKDRLSCKVSVPKPTYIAVNTKRM